MLYKRTKTGAIQRWQIIIDGNSYYTQAGKLDGKTIESDPTVCEGKNIGRANETTPEEQAFAAAEAKWKKQTESRYTTDLNEVDNALDDWFQPMLAHPWEKYKHKLKYPCLSQPKFDGARCIITKDGAYSRKGKEWVTIPHILEALKPVFKKYPNAIFDGELYNHLLSDDFEKIMSLIIKKKPTMEQLFEASDLVRYYIYDCPQIDELTIKDNFSVRNKRMHEVLTEMIPEHVGDGNCIDLVVTKPIYKEEELLPAHNAFADDGYEGLIIRQDKPYVNDRTHWLLKYKIFDDDEFIITDIIVGEGNRSTWAAKVECVTHEGKTFRAGIIGKGPYCQQLLKDRDEVIGKQATIKYFRYTKAGIPRFAKMVTVRDYE